MSPLYYHITQFHFTFWLLIYRLSCVISLVTIGYLADFLCWEPMLGKTCSYLLILLLPFPPTTHNSMPNAELHKNHLLLVLLLGSLPGLFPPGLFPPGLFPPGLFPPGLFPPGSFPPGSLLLLVLLLVNNTKSRMLIASELKNVLSMHICEIKLYQVVLGCFLF